ncbi:hypothetical protein A0U40_03290 [[Bacillus] sp. KCTC 13219]|nr:hypothetical protein A0U40_03290 [[Bacillus] sp. KCTC 13219]
MSNSKQYTTHDFEALRMQVAACKEKLEKAQNNNAKAQLLQMKQRISTIKNQLQQPEKLVEAEEYKPEHEEQLMMEKRREQRIDDGLELSYRQLQQLLHSRKVKETNITETRHLESRVAGPRHFNEHYFQSVYTYPSHVHNGLYRNAHKPIVLRDIDSIQKNEHVPQQQTVPPKIRHEIIENAEIPQVEMQQTMNGETVSFEELEVRQESPQMEILATENEDLKEEPLDFITSTVALESINEETTYGQKKEKHTSWWNFFRKK